MTSRRTIFGRPSARIVPSVSMLLCLLLFCPAAIAPARGQEQGQGGAGAPAAPKPIGSLLPKQEDLNKMRMELRKELAPILTRLRRAKGDERIPIFQEYADSAAAFSEKHNRHPAAIKAYYLALFETSMEVEYLNDAYNVVTILPQEVFTKEELNKMWGDFQIAVAKVEDYATVAIILMRRMEQYDYPREQALADLETCEDKVLKNGNVPQAIALLKVRLDWGLSEEAAVERRKKFLPVAVRKGLLQPIMELTHEMNLAPQDVIRERVRCMREYLQANPKAYNEPEAAMTMLALAFDSLAEIDDEKRVSKAEYLLPIVQKFQKNFQNAAKNDAYFEEQAGYMAAGIERLEKDLAALKKIAMQDDPETHEFLGLGFLERGKYLAAMHHLGKSNHFAAAAARKYVDAQGKCKADLVREFRDLAHRIPDDAQGEHLRTFVLSYLVGQMQLSSGAEYNEWERYLFQEHGGVLGVPNAYVHYLPRSWQWRTAHNFPGPRPTTTGAVAEILSRDCVLALDFNASVGNMEEEAEGSDYRSIYRDKSRFVDPIFAYTYGAALHRQYGFRQRDVFMTGGYISLPNLRERLLAQEPKALTFSVWCKAAPEGVLFDCGTHPGKNISLATNWFSIRDGEGGTKVRWEMPKEPSKFEWVHLAAIWNGTKITVYRNGKEVATGTTQAIELTPETIPGKFHAVLGAATEQSAGSPLDGMLDELAIFTRALTPEEIRTLYEHGEQGGTLPLPKSKQPPAPGAAE